MKVKKRKRRAGYLYSPAEIFDFFKPRGLVLDLGCGGGRNTHFMLEQGLAVVAMDNSPKLVSLDNNAVRSDGTELPFRDESFDSVLCNHVLEHLPDPEPCIKEVHRVLKRAGVACFAAPCLNIPLKMLVPLYRRLARFDLTRAREEHLHVFSVRQLLSMLEPSFQLTDVRYTDFATIMQRRMGIGYGLDHLLSAATEKVSPLRYFAASVLVRCIKLQD